MKCTESFSFCLRGSFTFFSHLLFFLSFVVPIEEPLDLASSNVGGGGGPKVTSVEEHHPVIMEMVDPVSNSDNESSHSVVVTWCISTNTSSKRRRKVDSQKLHDTPTSTRVSSHQQRKGPVFTSSRSDEDPCYLLNFLCFGKEELGYLRRPIDSLFTTTTGSTTTFIGTNTKQIYYFQLI